MPKENNCRCVVCQLERSLLNSLSTQTARTHFQALAHNYPILNHFDSPADVIAQLHEHERVELVNHKAWNGILHALVDSIANRTAEDIGQSVASLGVYARDPQSVRRSVPAVSDAGGRGCSSASRASIAGSRTLARNAKSERLFARCTRKRLPQATDPLGLGRNPVVRANSGRAN